MNDDLRILQTPRLRLRPWCDDDLTPFAALNASSDVMRYFPAPLDRSASDRLAQQIRDNFEKQNYGLWATERRDTQAFIGFVGLSQPSYETHFTPCTEIGWRLAATHWGQGFATEAARAVLKAAFGPIGLAEVVSFTSVDNLPSRRVMEKIGMQRDPEDDFDHPRLPAGHPLTRHVLYRIRPSAHG